MSKKNHRSINYLLPSIVIAMVMSSGLSETRASDELTCKVFAIQASNLGTGIDNALSPYVGIFKQKPFSQFNSFKLVFERSYKLKFGMLQKLSFPDSIAGTLRLNGEEKGRFHLTLTVARKGHKPIDIRGQASPGVPFFAAGFSNDKGVWVFGVACTQSEIISH